MLPGTQQTPPAAAPINSTATTATKNFTHAELGQRSTALGVDKKLQRMNDQQSQSGRSSLRQLLGTESEPIAGDRSFSSITDIEQLPPSVIAILSGHGLGFSDGDKIIHQPGASFFSLATTVDGVKKYQTFSFDEPVTPKLESEVESDNPKAPVVLEAPVAGTLGTVGVVQSSPYQEEVSERSEDGGVVSIKESSSAAVATPPPQAVPLPLVRGGLTSESRKESIKLELQSMEAQKTESPLEIAQKHLTTARNASGREREAYMANTYRDRADGTFSALFGNNAQVRDKLFVTITNYESAKKEYLSEIKKQAQSLSSMIEWERAEQSRLSELLPHKKFGIYGKLANMFHLAPPAKLETRSLVIANAPIASRVAMAQQLGIHDLTKQEPAWMKLFSPLEHKPLPESRIKYSSPLRGAPLQEEQGTTRLEVSPLVEPVGASAEAGLPEGWRDTDTANTGASPHLIPELGEGANTPEIITRKPNYKQLYTKLHTIMRLEWKLDRSVQSENPDPSIMNPPALDTAPDVVSMEHSGESPTPTIKEVAPVATSPEPVVIEPVTPDASSPLQFGVKQHPESLFV